MRIILSPAKKMNIDTDNILSQDLPVFLEETEEILSYLKSLTYDELKKLWACNDKIAEENYERIQYMNLHNALTPAILSYDGIAFQYMGPSVFQNNEFDYVQEHLRILSAFYGVVKPLDGVTPYRLEMQAKAKIGGRKNLYDYWKNKIYQEVVDDSHIIINLASKEYSKCIEKYLTPQDRYITCVFAEYVGMKVVQKGVYAKMARGEMVRYMAEHNVEDPEEMKGFDRLGFRFDAGLSKENEYVFLKN